MFTTANHKETNSLFLLQTFLYFCHDSVLHHHKHRLTIIECTVNTVTSLGVVCCNGKCKIPSLSLCSLELEFCWAWSC